MSKLKYTTMLAVGLFIANLVLVSYILLKGHEDREPRGPRDVIEKRLQFDEAQKMAYDKLIQEHRKAVRKSNEEILSIKKSMYADLAINDNKAPNDSLVKVLGQLQQNIELVHYQHFLEIKKLCKPEQLGFYNELVKDIADLFSKHQGPPPPREKQ